MTNATDALRALADRVASLATDWGDMDEAERRDAIANELRALATPAGSASGEDAAKFVVYRLRKMAQGGPLAYDAIACDEAADTINALQAEVARLREDAARYRWLVENAVIETDAWRHDGRDAASTKQPLDNAIDAAMGSANGQG